MKIYQCLTFNRCMRMESNELFWKNFKPWHWDIPEIAVGVGHTDDDGDWIQGDPDGLYNSDDYITRVGMYDKCSTADPKLSIDQSFENDQYIRLNQWQRLLTNDEATLKLNPFQALKVSWWMKTTYIETYGNFPAVEVGITRKGNPGSWDNYCTSDAGNTYHGQHLYQSLGDYHSFGEEYETSGRGGSLRVSNTTKDKWENLNLHLI